MSVGFCGLLHAELERKAGESFLRGITAKPRPLFFGNPPSSFHPRFALCCPLERVFVFHGLILAQGAKSRSRWAGATDALLRYRESPDAQRAALNDSWTERGLVLPNTRGDPADADNFHHRHWKPLLKKAGYARHPLPRSPSHLRHPPAHAGRPPQGRLRDARSRQHFHHARHLQPRHARAWETQRLPRWRTC